MNNKYVKLSDMYNTIGKYLKENGDKIVSTMGSVNGVEDVQFRLYLAPLDAPNAFDRYELDIKKTEI